VVCIRDRALHRSLGFWRLAYGIKAISVLSFGDRDLVVAAIAHGGWRDSRELHLKVARNFTFEQTETIIGRADRVCLLKNQLSAIVEPLECARNRECQQQPYQGEYGALDRSESCHAAGTFLLLQVSQAKVSSEVQQGQRTDEEGHSDY